jgi:hypothetical protein
VTAAYNASDAQVTFQSPIASGGTAPVNAVCAPPSGINLPVNTTTTVTCTATDAKQRTASCSFQVTVKAAPIPVIGITKFAAFGDSMTWGEDGQDDSGATPLDFRITPRVRVHTPYPEQLRNLLNQRYINQAGQFIVDNDGCGGEALQPPPAGSKTYDCIYEFNLDNSISRFEVMIRRGTLAGGAPYDAVLIMEGANDVAKFAGDALASGKAISALQSMIDYAKLFNVRPYVATLPPENAAGKRGAGAPYVDGFNSQIIALAALEGATLVDVHGAVSQSMLAPDGLHLTTAGYNAIAQAFLDKLSATADLPVTSSRVPVQIPTRRVR